MISHSKQDDQSSNSNGQQIKSAAPLCVLLINENPDRTKLVEQGLEGFSIVHTADKSNGQNVIDLIAKIQPEIIIIDCFSADVDSIKNLKTISENSLCPVVMFVEEENSQGLQQAINAGVSAYVVDGLTPKRVKPVIDVAIARFKVMSDLRYELKKTKDDLSARKIIEKAKGILMQKRAMSEEEAYAAMRTMSQERSMPLKNVAENVIAILGLLDK